MASAISSASVPDAASTASAPRARTAPAARPCSPHSQSCTCSEVAYTPREQGLEIGQGRAVAALGDGAGRGGGEPGLVGGWAYGGAVTVAAGYGIGPDALVAAGRQQQAQTQLEPAVARLDAVDVRRAGVLGAFGPGIVRKLRGSCHWGHRAALGSCQRGELGLCGLGSKKIAHAVRRRGCCARAVPCVLKERLAPASCIL